MKLFVLKVGKELLETLEQRRYEIIEIICLNTVTIWGMKTKRSN